MAGFSSEPPPQAPVFIGQVERAPVQHVQGTFKHQGIPPSCGIGVAELPTGTRALPVQLSKKRLQQSPRNTFRPADHGRSATGMCGTSGRFENAELSSVLNHGRTWGLRWCMMSTLLVYKLPCSTKLQNWACTSTSQTA